MKKGCLIIFFLMICLLSACNQTDENNASTASADKLEGNLTVFGGSVGGAWSVFTEGISEAVRKEYPGTMISAVPGTVAGNPLAVSEGKTDFAISESLTANFAYEGHFPFDQAHENIRAVAAIMPINVFQFVAPEKVSFDSVEDIVKEDLAIRYSAGEKDALGDIVSASIFQAYGIDYGNIEDNGGELNFLSGSKSFEMMADGRLDGLGKMVPVPTSDILEASATIDLKLIPIGDTAIDYLEKEYGMMPFTIEKDTYDFQKEAYETVNSPTILITQSDQSEETVYQMTKAIYEQLDYLADVHNGFKEINDESIIGVGKVPMHPGAEKFYREAGLMD